MRREIALLCFCLFLSSYFTQSSTFIGGERTIWELSADSCDTLIFSGNSRIFDINIANFLSAPFDRAHISDDQNSPSSCDEAQNIPVVTYGSFTEEVLEYPDYTVKKQIYFSPTLGVSRVLYTLTATSKPVSVDWSIEVHTDGYTELIADYSNDLAFDETDQWFVLGPASPSTTSYATFSVFGPGASVLPTTQVDFGTDYFHRFHLTLQPGVPQSLLFFLELSTSEAKAIAVTPRYISVPALQQTDLLFGLSSLDLDSIVNWNLKTERKTSSFTGICDFADEIKNRISKLRPNERHSFTQPWKC